VRAGIETVVPAAQLVVGDIVLLEAGDRVPADGRLLEAASLRVVESALTGESEPARKSTDRSDAAAALGDRVGMVFAGTAVAVGRARFVVSATGSDTEMGRIADLLAAQEDESTPLQRELDRVGKRIALLVLAIAAVVFAEQIALLFAHSGDTLAEALADPAIRTGLTAALLIAVSLAVAAIPEGLPAVVTMALSLGVRKMAEHNALVRKLHAVETLGCTSFICSDKTGTITRNEMAVRQLVVGLDEARVTAEWGLEPLEHPPVADDLTLLLEIAASNNDARPAPDDGFLGDPTEIALLDAASHLAPGHLRPTRTAEVPFDSARKRMTTVHEIEGRRIAFVKGGTDVVLALCTHARLRGHVGSLDDDTASAISATNERIAASGYRTLAVAMRELAPDEVCEDASVERDLTYVGILALIDPPRPEVVAALAECRQAGISVAMVTGDHALTARAVAIEIGLLSEDDPEAAVISGAELSAMSDEELAARAEQIRVYARVSPEDKLRIVGALKADGETVAMTGDGVNDAPALKRADIGVAMGQIGTDVAREAADMVLADDDFATIVEAVREGRTVFDNLKKVILFLLSCNVSEVLVVFLMAFAAPGIALLPLQLLWINLVTDGPPALALGVDRADPRVMHRPPRNVTEPILNKRRLLEIAGQGSILTAASLVAVAITGGALHAPAPVVRTVLFTVLVLAQNLHAFNFVAGSRGVFSSAAYRNRALLAAFLGSLALQTGAIYLPGAQRVFGTAPLSAIQWAVVAITALLAATAMNLGKPRREEPVHAG
jgi:Ca2+-transporting ATPase